MGEYITGAGLCALLDITVRLFLLTPRISAVSRIETKNLVVRSCRTKPQTSTDILMCELADRKLAEHWHTHEAIAVSQFGTCTMG